MKRNFFVCIGFIVAMLIISYAFVPQVLEGKILNQGDISGFRGMAHEATEWNAAHPDDKTHWTGAMFSGMPTTTIISNTEGDWTQPLYDILLKGKRPASYLFISMFGAFLMMLALGISPIVAFGGALAVTFCSYNMQILQVGHNTKMQALAFLPWVLAALFITYRGILKDDRRWLMQTLLGSAFFGLAVSFQVKANHPQITYYLAMAILIYAVVMLVWLLLRKKGVLGRFAVASALLLVLGVCGIGTNATKLLPVLEYTPHSMRGGASSGSDGEQKKTKGLDLDYATAWSYGWEELPNLLIPDYNGGSSAESVNPKTSETYQVLKKAGQPNLRETCRNLPLYWGPQPFTAGPMYMGAVTIFLFVLGLMYYSDRREKWWILAASIIAVLLALGSHFLWFTKLFYNWAPMYSKFRTVSMSLVMLQFTLPILGFLMLDGIVRGGTGTMDRKQVLKAGAVTAGLCLFLAVVQSAFGSFSGASDAGMPDILTDAFAADRHHLLWADTWRSILFIACSSLILFWGLSATTDGKRTVSAALICALVLLDLSVVDRRYLSSDDFVAPREFDSQFAKRQVDEMILLDTDPSYRVLDLTVNVFNDSHPSYWHKSIGGYSPAKLQNYQALIESNLAAEINTIYKLVNSKSTVSEIEGALPFCPALSALNCRYIIVGAENAPVVNGYARGNAWFESGEKARMTSYAPHRMNYNYSSETGGTLVFSEVYYPEGWKLRLDGDSEIPISLYGGSDSVPGNILRCAEVPAGTHELEMSFEPTSYSRGAAISRICSFFIILLVLAAIGAALLGNTSFKIKQ